jgi:DNA-binding winged helix-turn-helix (wHTH) protein/TolB-like protein/Flp pilus assembly protein TadD
MNEPLDPIYEFNGFRLEPGKRVLSDPEGNALKLLPKAFDILVFLVENRERVVTKEDLFAKIWADTIVEENNLTQNISGLRRAFGEKPSENRFISTVPGKGYRFVAPVTIDRPREMLSTPVPSAEAMSGPTARSAATTRWSVIAFSVLVIVSLTGAGYWYLRKNADASNLSSLAILPLKPITNENRDEALEMGVTDALISKLGTAEELRVLPMAAVRRFASPEQDPLSAGRQLNVDAVLDGGIQISSGRVRLSAKLLRVSDGRQLWSGQFDEELNDIFSVQDSISQRVAAALAKPLGERSQARETRNAEAYQLFMRGRYHSNKLILPEVQKGIGYYQQAVSLDPGFALAYVEMANAYRAMVLTNDASPREMMPRSKAAAARAVELDDGLAEAWTALAFNEFWYDWDWRSSEEHFKRALDLDADSAQVHAFYAHMLSNTGRHDEAKREIRRAREIDPINPVYAAIEGQILSFAGQVDDSDLVLRSVIDLDPNFWLAHLFLAKNFIIKNKWSEALASAQSAEQITNGNSEAAGSEAFILGKLGHLEKARSVIGELETRSRERHVSAYSIALGYLGIGDKRTTLELLQKAVDEKEPLVVFLKVDPRWNELHAEPRFADLLRHLNLNE